MEIPTRRVRYVFGLSLILVFLVSFVSSGLAQSSVITTYVGPPLPLDGAMAMTQAIDQPSSVVPDGAGGFYVASVSQNRVYRVAVDGALTSIAGNSSNGFSGDGGPAASAQLNGPSAIALDATGNLYIADTYNSRVRKVTADGVISTVAGVGASGFSGDGGPATSAKFSYPHGIAVDAVGNLYVADTYNSRVRKITAGGVISTVAGDGTFGFSGDGGRAGSAKLRGPSGVAVDVAGNLYIADNNNARVRKVTADGMINSLAGIDGSLFAGIGPTGVAADAAGNLYIADSNRVLKVTPGGVISTAAGIGASGFSGDGGPATSAQLNLSFFGGVAADAAGNLYIADTNNSRVRKVTADGLISTVAGIGTGFGGDGGPAASAQLNFPSGVAVDAAGNLYIGDTNNYRVRKVTADGVISTVAGISTSGFSGDGGPAASAQLNGPRGVAVDVSGNLYIADTKNSRVRKVTADGVISTVAGNGTVGFSGDGGLATSAQLFLAPPNSGYASSSGIAVDVAGNLYIGDTNNYRVRKVTADGMISTIAGNGISGFSGDGGPAASAQLNLSFFGGVAVDVAGNLYIADTLNSRVRRVGNASDLQLVTDIQFDPFNVRIQSSWTATFIGINLTDQTYFDLRFRAPGNDKDQIALNWQRGTAAPHSVPSGTDAGTWTVTGVRPHQDVSDHSANFVSVSKTLVVTQMAF